jgi:hypothetical protein
LWLWGEKNWSTTITAERWLSTFDPRLSIRPRGLPRYAAQNLLYRPPPVAKDILQRPADFIRAAKEHREPELKF